MNSDRLLAKSLPTNGANSDSVFLPGHLRDVIEAARAVLDATAEDQLAALGLDADRWKRRFERIVLLAAALHDLGKANDHFQGMVQPEAFPKRRGLRQGLRHEWVSVLLAWDARFNLRESLARAVADEVDYWIALWAVGGHHPAYGRPSPPRFPLEGTGESISLMFDHEDFAAAVREIASHLTISLVPSSEIFRNRRLPLVGPDNAFERLFRFHRESRRVWESSCGDNHGSDYQRLTAAAKDCLVAADIAGSALPRSLDDAATRRAWIVDGFRRRPTPEDLADLIADRLSSSGPEVSVAAIDANLRPFQRDVAASAARVTFVKAGCGTGKTLAAYEWARRQAPARRLYFCYPTTGTATEGFRDYLVEEGVAKAGADLFHSRQQVDFEILGVRDKGERGVDDLAEAGDLAVRVAGLESWCTPIVACTCDAVLGIVQNNRRGLYSWPALAGAAFVFDEIHAYDDRLFGALLRFLEAMRGVKILLMTASLPAAREAAIISCLTRIGERTVNGQPLAVVSGPEDLERLGRYHRPTAPGDRPGRAFA